MNDSVRQGSVSNPISRYGPASRALGSASRTLACAIYTRKSSEEGLEQSFNSIDAQREACDAFILSQRHEGWRVLDTLYDDGGFSGGNMERPGLQQLMCDIAAKRIRVVVVYKVDRLTRSLTDFAKMVELFDAHEVSFVSVTQQFNTTTSMGRLTLNVLLSFAQFEREVTGERIRDKIAASKAKGMWMGGTPPVGYIPQDRTLVIDEGAARLVRNIFDLYLDLGCVRSLKEEADRRAWTTPARTSRRSGQSGNRPFSRGHLYRILSNPIYIGQIAHKDRTYPGQHAPIIERVTWDAVQAKLADNRQGHKQRGNALCPSLLAGLVWDEQGDRLTPSHSRKGNRRYRYYVSDSLIGNRASPDSMGMRIPAHELEQAVMHGLIRFLRQDADILRLLDERGITDAHPVHAILKRAHALAKQIEDRTPAFMNQADDGKPASAQRSDRACDTLDRRRLPALPEAALIGSTGLIGLLQALIQRIVVGSDQLQISVRVNVLLQDARGRLSGEQRDGLARSSPGRPDAVFTMPHGEASASVMPEGMISVPVPAMAKGMVHNRSDSSLVAGPVGKEQDVYTIILPMKLRRSGLAMRLIVPGQEVHRRPDARLGQLLVKAHDWLDRLTSGKAGSVLAIANEEKITSAYVTRVIGLAFLAPDIVKAILQGQQPETLTSDSLMRSMPLPIDWMEQKELLGFVS